MDSLGRGPSEFGGGQIAGSRVYSGIHWNFDDTMARAMGAALADHVAANHFAAVPEPSTLVLLVLGLGGFVASRAIRRR